MEVELGANLREHVRNRPLGETDAVDVVVRYFFGNFDLQAFDLGEQDIDDADQLRILEIAGIGELSVERSARTSASDAAGPAAAGAFFDGG